MFSDKHQDKFFFLFGLDYSHYFRLTGSVTNFKVKEVHAH